MAISFEKIKPGMRLVDIHKERRGNTKIWEVSCFPVDIVSVDSASRTAMVRWNGNPERKWYWRELKKLYAKVPPRFRKELDSDDLRLAEYPAGNVAEEADENVWPNVDVHAWAERHDSESAEGWLFLVLNGDVSIEEMRAAICEDRAPARKS
jgi:hypothetical protein